MGYERIFQFKGTWRKYQARVLANAGRYLRDGKVHIVAAPGSGKTTLGIELMNRIGRPALVFAPTITIREQWVARIASSFLKDIFLSFVFVEDIALCLETAACE